VLVDNVLQIGIVVGMTFLPFAFGVNSAMLSTRVPLVAFAGWQGLGLSTGASWDELAIDIAKVLEFVTSA